MTYVLPNFTDTGGMEEVAGYLAGQISGFWGGILFFIFIAIWGAGYFIQDRTKGAGNAAMWAAISSLITTSGAFVLYLYDNLVSIEIIIICIFVTIVSASAFIISQRN